MARYYREPRECPREIPSNDVIPFLQIIIEFMEILMSSFDDLKAQVEQNLSAEDSAVTLIKGIVQELKDALANSGANDPAITDLANRLHASAEALGAAVAANTPAAPVVTQPDAPVDGSVSAEPAPVDPTLPVDPNA